MQETGLWSYKLALVKSVLLGKKKCPPVRILFKTNKIFVIEVIESEPVMFTIRAVNSMKRLKSKVKDPA